MILRIESNLVYPEFNCLENYRENVRDIPCTQGHTLYTGLGCAPFEGNGVDWDIPCTLDLGVHHLRVMVLTGTYLVHWTWVCTI